MKVTFKDDTICDLNIIFGGVGKDVAMTIGDRLARLSGSVWNEHLLQCMLNIVDEHADMIKTFEKDFKQGVMKGFVFKFFHAVFLERYGTLSTGQIGLGPSVPARGTQKWQRHIDKSVGLSCHHTSSIQQTTGEALFIDDIIPRKDELFVSLVTSTRAHAKIKYIDYKEALELTGVKYYIDADDVPARNAIGANSAEEVLFARDKVTHCGQIIGAIIAESREIARHAAKRVVVGYEDLKPILTIEDAIEAESYFDMLKLVDGDVSKGFTSCDHIIEGEVMLGGQEHYYLETHISQVIPDNGDQTMVVLSSTQNPSGVQSSVAGILGFPCNKIISKLTRIGGGFGGKETRSDMFACICAVAAHRAKQPMRLVLEREDDMKISGGRHPYLARYKVGCTKNGKLLALDVQLYSNGGHSLDMTPYVMQYVLLDIPNCYIIPNVRLQGFMCKTNLPSNTAMRGFGCPQAVFITEHIVTDIAIKCNISQQRFRKINFIGKDFVTNYGQIVENCNAKRCFDECVEKSRFHVRQDQIQTFNRENRFVKKGISVTPVIMAVGFHCKLLNQVMAAYMGGVSLSATGYYIDEDITLDFRTFKGIASSSFVCGAACSEVEIDCLTGEHRVLSTDIVMDCGRTINPSIDIGQ
ncbi:xanthine dehydrogenase/oxidase-like, partial [Saccoglossus kowalevskii]